MIVISFRINCIRNKMV